MLCYVMLCYVCNVCMYVCTYVRTYVCTYVRTYVRACVRTYVRTYVRTIAGLSWAELSQPKKCSEDDLISACGWLVDVYMHVQNLIHADCALSSGWWSKRLAHHPDAPDDDIFVRNFERPFTSRTKLGSARNFGKTRFRRFATFHFSTLKKKINQKIFKNFWRSIFVFKKLAFWRS